MRMKSYLSEGQGLLTDNVTITAQGILDKFIHYQQGYRYIGEPEKYSFPQEVLEFAQTTNDTEYAFINFFEDEFFADYVSIMKKELTISFVSYHVEDYCSFSMLASCRYRIEFSTCINFIPRRGLSSLEQCRVITASCPSTSKRTKKFSQSRSIEVEV